LQRQLALSDLSQFFSDWFWLYYIIAGAYQAGCARGSGWLLGRYRPVLGEQLMAEHFNVEVLAIALYLVVLIVCLGLIAYVVWGWRKRMRYTVRKSKGFSD
jgi:hypothetical protein